MSGVLVRGFTWLLQTSFSSFSYFQNDKILQIVNFSIDLILLIF